MQSGLDSTVVSISHCGCDDPSSILGLDKKGTFLHASMLHDV